MRAFGLALLSGFLYIDAYYVPDARFLAFVALIPLLFAVWQSLSAGL